MSTQGTRQDPPKTKRPPEPGACFGRGGFHYVVVDERIVPHIVENTYVIDTVYVPGSGTLCCCIETGELERFNSLPSDLWTPRDEITDDVEEFDVPDQSHSPSVEKLLQTLGLRRKP